MKVFKTGAQHSYRNLSMTDIVDPAAEWEMVAQVYGAIEGINFDTQGRLWLVSSPAGEIIRIDNDGKPVTVGPKADSPKGMAFHKDGRLFVADRNGKLYWVDPDTGDRHMIADRFRTQHFRGLNDCVFDDKGGLYFTEPYGSNTASADGRVFYLPPGGGKDDIQVYMQNIAYPNGVCLSPNYEWVYVAEFARNRVIVAQGFHPIDKIDPPHLFCNYEGGIGPDGIATDEKGNLYCAHFGMPEVSVVNPMGIHYGSIGLPEGCGPRAVNLAFNNGYLYVEECSKNEIWRIKVKNEGMRLYSHM